MNDHFHALLRLNANYYGYIRDYSIGSLGAGTHTVTIVADSDRKIDEVSETDNEYTKTITVLPETPVGDLPNLIPYQPKDWSDAIVVSTSKGVRTDSILYRDEDTLYVSWAVLNEGPVATPGGFSVDLYIDGWYENTWSSSSSLKANYYRSIKDYSIGTLSGGDHTIALVVDSDQVIPESDEDETIYFKEIRVEGILFFETLPNLTLYQPEGWSDKIVVSSSKKTSAGSNSFTSADTLYVDWAVHNNGQGDTPKRVSVSLYVDEVLKKTWKLPILKAGGVEPFLAGSSNKEKTNYIVRRYSIGKLSAGDHTITLVIDPKGAIVEDSKADNIYHKSVHIVEAP